MPFFLSSVSYEHTEDIIIPRQKIDRFTFDRYNSHLIVIDLEDDDDGDVEGDQAGLSGDGPSEVSPSNAGHPRGAPR